MLSLVPHQYRIFETNTDIREEKISDAKKMHDSTSTSLHMYIYSTIQCAPDKVTSACISLGFFFFNY